MTKKEIAFTETVDTIAYDEVDTLLVSDSMFSLNNHSTIGKSDDKKENTGNSIIKSDELLSKAETDTVVNSNAGSDNVRIPEKPEKKIDNFYQKSLNKIKYWNSSKQDVTGIGIVINSVTSIFKKDFDVLSPFFLFTFLGGALSTFLSLDKKRNMLLVINILQLGTLLYTYWILAGLVEKLLFGFWIALSISILNLILVIWSKLKLYFQL